MKLVRLTALLAVPAALLAASPSAQATVLVCGDPVTVSCYHVQRREWCDVWVKATGTCLQLADYIQIGGGA